MHPVSKRIALFFTPSPLGGGVARAMFNLAGAFAERGHEVDLVLPGVHGPYVSQIPASVRVVALTAAPWWRGPLRMLTAQYNGSRALLLPVLLARVFRYVPDLVRYLQQEQPAVLLSAKTQSNLAALWARRLARIPTRAVVSEHTSLSHEILSCTKEGKWHWRCLPPVIRCVYPWADAIVAVSIGAANDLSATASIPRERITTVYNPVVTPELQAQIDTPLDHPWFAPGSPPVLLGVGRLEAQKDFPTLLQAFARVQAVRPARLLILGEGKKRGELEALARQLGVAADVALPGFVANPFAYMARAAAFVLSSAYEGLSVVLIEALACGCPVVSTDCPSGPAEILDGGRYGPLVPVGDDTALAEAILTVLATPPDPEKLRTRATMFALDRAVDQYLHVMLGAPPRV